jgi:hypothetical protein
MCAENAVEVKMPAFAKQIVIKLAENRRAVVGNELVHAAAV